MNSAQRAANKYWKDRPYKKWVVTLIKTVHLDGKLTDKTETKFVCATTKEGAVNTAKAFSLMHGRLKILVRLATAKDFTCDYMTTQKGSIYG